SKLGLMSSSDYIDVEKELFSQGYYDSYLTDNTNYPAVSPVVEILNKQKAGLLTTDEANRLMNSFRSVNLTDQYGKYMYRKRAYQQYNVNLQGGSNKMTYFFSAGYDQDMSSLSADNDRITIRSNNTYTPLRSLEFSANIQLTKDNISTGKPDYGVLRVGRWSIPYISLADKSGNPLPVARNYSQLYIDTAGGRKLLDWNYYPLTDWQHDKTNTVQTDVLASFGIKAHPLSGVTANVLYQYERQNGDARTLQDPESYGARNLINLFTQIAPSGEITYILPQGGILSAYNTTVESQSVRGQLGVDKTLGKHVINAIAGGELRQVHSFTNGNSFYGYDD
ncbi:MAG: hypothetical protein ACRDE7_14990, partial [Sphingobacterium sp.]